METGSRTARRMVPAPDCWVTLITSLFLRCIRTPKANKLPIIRLGVSVMDCTGTASQTPSSLLDRIRRDCRGLGEIANVRCFDSNRAHSAESTAGVAWRALRGELLRKLLRKLVRRRRS